MKHIYSSIEFGSDTIKIVVCELYKNKLNLLAAVSSPTRGIKHGLVNDLILAKESIKEAFNQIEKMLGIKVERVIANIPSYFNDFSLVTGELQLENARVIAPVEVASVISDVLKSVKDVNREIVAVLPIDFKVDKNIVPDPKGITGKLLEVRAIMVTTTKKNVYSVVGILESLGIEVVDISTTSVGDMFAYKVDDIKDKSGIVVDIGSEETTVSLFNKGIIVKNSVIQMGGKNIDGDIAYVYKLSMEEAKKIKEKIGVAHKSYANSSEVFEIVNKLGELVPINQVELSEIMYARLEQMLDLVKKETNSLANRQIDYIILTGGSSNIPYIDKVTQSIMNTPTIVGQINLLGLRNNKYSVCLGNIMYFIRKLKIKGKNYTMISSEDSDTISSPRKNNINETNIFRAFMSFFDE